MLIHGHFVIESTSHLPCQANKHSYSHLLQSVSLHGGPPATTWLDRQALGPPLGLSPDLAPQPVKAKLGPGACEASFPATGFPMFVFSEEWAYLCSRILTPGLPVENWKCMARGLHLCTDGSWVAQFPLKHVSTDSPVCGSGTHQLFICRVNMRSYIGRVHSG